MHHCILVGMTMIVIPSYLCKTVKCNTLGGWLLIACQALEASIIDYGIKLILIDSIAVLARSEFSQDRITDRQQVLGK